MKIEFIETVSGNHKFSVDGTTIVFWESFSRSIMALSSFAQSHNFQKVVFENSVEGIKKFIVENESFIKSYIASASTKQSVIDSYSQLQPKRLITATENGSVLIVKIDLTRGYVSVTANEVHPTAEDVLIEQSSPMWIEHFMKTEKISEEEATEKVKQQVRMEGVEAVADISLFSDSFNHNGIEYCFDSVGCGCMHTEIKKAYKQLNFLIKNHLKEITPEILWEFSLIKEDVDWRQKVCDIGKELIK